MAQAILPLAFVAITVGEGVNASAVAFAISEVSFVVTPVRERHNASAGNLSIAKLSFVASPVGQRHNASAGNLSIAKLVDVGAVTASPPIKIFSVVASELGFSVVLPVPLDDAAPARATIQGARSSPGHCCPGLRIGVPDPAP